MKENKQKFWFFDPAEHGGEKDMIYYFAAIITAVIALIIGFIKFMLYAE